MRLLVTGSRTWGERGTHMSAEAARLCREPDAIAPHVVIHGGARGADEMAGMWCGVAGVECIRCPADWTEGKSAGPRRNARMLAERAPNRGLAFGPLYRETNIRGGGQRGTGWPRTGTGDMVKRMLAAGLPVRWVETHAAPAVDLVWMPESPA